MKFPKPIFLDLQRVYDDNPEGTHQCSRIYRYADRNVAEAHTSVVRLCEALVLAVRLVRFHQDIAPLNERGGDGRDLLFGRFGYKANLCPHGLPRGARDFAHFLEDHWGRPSKAWRDLPKTDVTTQHVPEYQEKIFGELKDERGLVGFFDLDEYNEQGGFALFDRHEFVGTPYWQCRSIKFWRLY